MAISIINKISEAAKKRCTPEWRRAVSERQLGHEVSEETRRKISVAQKGRKIPQSQRDNMSKAKMGHSVSEETRNKLSEANRRSKPEGFGKKISEGLKGRKLSDEHKEGLSRAFRGENNPNWKGGVSSENHKLRTSKRWSQWRERVFERDNWTCQDCGERGCTLHPHHILPLADHPEFAYDVDNGITLCVPCHRGRHGWEVKLVKNE